MAIFRIEHSTLGRSTHSPGTAAAHARYITRPKACELILGINFSAHREAARRQVAEHELALKRKNARIADKILVSLPVEMNLEQRADTVRLFIWHLTGFGKGRALACFHEQGGGNPHVHIFLVDRDDHGKAVYGTSTKGSTARIRKLWEGVCNQKLAEYGHGVRIHRRSRLEQGLNPAPGREPSPYRPEPRDATKRHQPALETLPPAADIEINEAIPDEDLVADTVIRTGRDDTLESVIADLALFDEELIRLQGVKQLHRELTAREKTLDARLARAEQQLATVSAQLDAAMQRQAKAEANLKNHRGLFGRLRGLALFGWKSHGRRQAEIALQRAELSGRTVELQLATANRLATEREHLGRDTADLMRQQTQTRQQMALYGTEQDMQQAEVLLQTGIKLRAQGLDADYVMDAGRERQIDDRQLAVALKLITREQAREDRGLSH